MSQPSLEENIKKASTLLNTIGRVFAPYVDDTVLAVQRSLKYQKEEKEKPNTMTRAGKAFSKRANIAGSVVTTAADELLPKIYFATKRLTRIDQMLDEASHRPIAAQNDNKPKGCK